MKDELGGKIMKEFVAFRAKMYVYRKQMLFENKKHEVYKVNRHKIALNRDDDKRILQGDGITTLARGYAALWA